MDTHASFIVLKTRTRLCPGGQCTNYAKEYFVAIYVSLDEINFQLLPWIFVITIDNTGMP